MTGSDFKERAHAVIDALPDDATWADLMREIHAIGRSKRGGRTGRQGG